MKLLALFTYSNKLKYLSYYHYLPQLPITATSKNSRKPGILIATLPLPLCHSSTRISMFHSWGHRANPILHRFYFNCHFTLIKSHLQNKRVSLYRALVIFLDATYIFTICLCDSWSSKGYLLSWIFTNPINNNLKNVLHPTWWHGCR